MKKKKRIPKYPIGGLLASSGLSLISGLLGNAKIKKEQEEATNRANALTRQSNLQQDIVALEDFSQEGNGMVDYYAAKGGKLARPTYMTKGGDLEPLSSDMELAKGNKHNEDTIDSTTGIKLYAEGGDAIAEIEDEETIKDDKVYSDQIKTPRGKTYAEEAEKLGRKKGKLEEALETGDAITRNTNERRISILDAKEEQLFAEQEQSKQANMETEQMGKGGYMLAKGGFAKGVEAFAPYIDNVTNAILTAGTPKIPDVQIQRGVKLPTTVNVQPQLNEVGRAVDSATTGIKNNTANSATARNEMTSARLRGANAKANILASKENQENQLKTNNIQANANINAKNLASINNNQMQKTMRAGDIQNRISDNAANVASDFIDKRNFDAAEAYNKERIDIAQNTYQKDTTRRAMLDNPSEIEYLRNNPEAAAIALEKFKGTPEEWRLRDLLRVTRPVSTFANTID